MEKWKVAAYVRLSSDDGDKAESNSITNQKSLINLFLKNNTDLKLKDFYIDDGFSGTDFNRPDFQRLLNDMKNGKINAVLVKDLSRLGRNYIEVGNYLEQIFPLYNIRFIAINDNVDSFKDPNSVNNVIVPFKNLMNDEYARDISNKVRSVLDTKKVNGEFIGSLAPYGYIRNPRDPHKLIVDRESAKIVKKIFRMILNGYSKSEIADELNNLGVLPPRLYQIEDKKYKFTIKESMKLWDRFKIDGILKNRVYIGDLVQSKRRTISHKIHKTIHSAEENLIIVHNHHESIVSDDEFEQVQDIIFNRDKKIHKDNKYDLFIGHIKCADCGNSFTVKKSKKYEYYYCNSFLREKSCTNHSISKKKLEELVKNMIDKQIEMVLDIDDKIESIVLDEEVNYDIEILNSRINEINNNILKYEKLKETIKDDYICKFISKDEFEEYDKEYEYCISKQLEAKNNATTKLKQLNPKSDENKFWIEKYRNNKGIKELNRKVINELVDDIIIYESGNIEIIFKYKDEFDEALNFIKKHNCIEMNDFIYEHNYDIISRELYAI